MRLPDLHFPSSRRSVVRELALATFVAMAGTASAAEPTATVVEFRNAALDHYFITASPAEAARARCRWRQSRLDAHRGRMEGLGERGGDARRGARLPLRRGSGSGPTRASTRRAPTNARTLRQNPAWKFEGDRILDRAARRHAGGALVPRRARRPSTAAIARATRRPMTTTASSRISRCTRRWRAPRPSKAWSCARRFRRRRSTPTSCACWNRRRGARARR